MEEIIYSNLKFSETEGEPVTVINYRGYELGVWCDDNGQQFYTYIDDEEIGFGAFNTNFQDDLEYLIDKELDHIYSYGGRLFGGQLDWFDNAGYRDIKLVYRLRTLKIWVISNPQLVKEELLQRIQEEGKAILEKYLKITSK